MVKYVVKRDGRLVDFNNQKIVAAILKAMDVTETGEDIVLAAKIADTISKKETERMGVEEIQDCVEFELMKVHARKSPRNILRTETREISRARPRLAKFSRKSLMLRPMILHVRMRT